MNIQTCRFCGMSNYEHNHPAAKSEWVKYGPRHWAHLKCAIERKGASFLRGLPTHWLESLPLFELLDLGMEDVLRDELSKRGIKL
jgi:hypothetical protein